MRLEDFSVQDSKGEQMALEKFRGQVVLIVNTASQCGFTPQYAGLQALHAQYAARGFCVLAFPCNQFGAQEPDSDAAIQDFCTSNYGLSFPVFAKIEVNGDAAHPLYQWLTQSKPGLLGSERIKWNFTKFLLRKDGSVYARYAPLTKPAELGKDIEKLLAE